MLFLVRSQELPDVGKCLASIALFIKIRIQVQFHMKWDIITICRILVKMEVVILII